MLPRLVQGTAVLAALLVLAACGDSDPVAPPPETRVYAVVLADEQALPAQRECPAPEPGTVTGTRFLEGDLTLFPEGTFRWRYTIEHYEGSQRGEQAWVARVSVVGAYVIRGQNLELHDSRDDADPRMGRIEAGSVEITEALPCHSAAGESSHHADLYLTPAE